MLHGGPALSWQPRSLKPPGPLQSNSELSGRVTAGFSGAKTAPSTEQLIDRAGDGTRHPRLQDHFDATGNRFPPIEDITFSPPMGYSIAVRTNPRFALDWPTRKTGFVLLILPLRDVMTACDREPKCSVNIELSHPGRPVRRGLRKKIPRGILDYIVDSLENFARDNDYPVVSMQSVEA